MESKINIYPNPTSSKIFIDINLEIISNVKIEVLNSSGQVLQNRFVVKNEVIKEEVDLGAYSNGIYFIRISNDQINYVKKIILQ